MAPYSEYLLLDAQPPIMIPYTPREVKPRMYKIPMFRSVTCRAISRPNRLSWVPQGITALVMQATNMNAPGARI